VLEAVREPLRPPRSAFAEYDIASVARQVDGLYETCYAATLHSRAAEP